MADLVIISMHERGFPQADLHTDCSDMDPLEFERLGRSPDGFFTMSRGDSLEAAASKAARDWPGAKIVYAAEDDEDEDECDDA